MNQRSKLVVPLSVLHRIPPFKKGRNNSSAVTNQTLFSFTMKSLIGQNHQLKNKTWNKQNYYQINSNFTHIR